MNLSISFGPLFFLEVFDEENYGIKNRAGQANLNHNGDSTSGGRIRRNRSQSAGVGTKHQSIRSGVGSFVAKKFKRGGLKKWP